MTRGPAHGNTGRRRRAPSPEPGLPTTPGSVIYWLGSFAHLRNDGRWVDDNGESVTSDRIEPYAHPELYVVWDAASWAAPALPGERADGEDRT